MQYIKTESGYPCQKFRTLVVSHTTHCGSTSNETNKNDVLLEIRVADSLSPIIKNKHKEFMAQ